MEPMCDTCGKPAEFYVREGVYICIECWITGDAEKHELAEPESDSGSPNDSDR